MCRTDTESGLYCRAAHIHFGARDLFRNFREHHMIDGVGADRRQRIGRQVGEFVPTHTQLVAERRNVYLIASREIAHGRAQLGFARQAAQPHIKPIERVALFRDAGAAERLLLPAKVHIDRGIASHDRFKKTYELIFPLASDESGGVVEAFGAWVEKSMYGKKYMGIDRSTFLVGSDSRIVKAWRGVKVPEHVEEVLAAAGAVEST